MTAPAMPADLGERILAQLAGHDSKRPARADDVAALVGGDEPAYWAAIEQLKGRSQINCAHIKGPRDPEPWLAIWPTGLPARMDTWHDLNARGHFNSRRPFTPQRMPQGLAARRAAQEIEMKQTPDTTEQRREHIAACVLGRQLEDGVTLKAIAEELGLSVEGVRHLVKTMEGGQRVARGRIPGEQCHRLYAPAAAVTPAAAVCRSLAAIADAIGDMEPEGEPAPEAPSKGPAEPCMAEAAAQVAHVGLPPARIEFALWDDGRVCIYDGDTLLQLSAADTVRLARLLGVPGHALGSEVVA